MDISICISFIDCNSEYISQTYFYLPFISYPTPYVFLVTIHDRLSLVQSIANENYIHTYIHTLLLFLHETSSVKNQYNDIKDKIEKKNVLFFQRVVLQCFVHGIFSSSGALLVLF